MATISLALPLYGAQANHLTGTQPNSGSVLVYSNFLGVNHHGYDHAGGSALTGLTFGGLTLGHAFRVQNDVVFADAKVALGFVRGDGMPPQADVYIAADSDGLPGTLLDGPLTQLAGIVSLNKGGNIVEFDCVTCVSLTAHTQYWLVIVIPDPNVELFWMNALNNLTTETNCSTNGDNSATGPWFNCSAGHPRGAFQIDGN